MVTNKPNKNPMPENPSQGLVFRCNVPAKAQITAKNAQIAELNLTMVVRVLFAFCVVVFDISCSIRISPVYFSLPEGIGPGEILISYRAPNLKKGFWEESVYSACSSLMKLRKRLGPGAVHSDQSTGLPSVP